MSDRRTARRATARLSSGGYLRLSSDLVPSNAKDRDFSFVVVPLPPLRQLQLHLVENYSGGGDGAHRKALYANLRSRCPLISVKAAMKFLGVGIPKTSREFPVRKRKNILTVQF